MEDMGDRRTEKVRGEAVSPILSPQRDCEGWEVIGQRIGRQRKGRVSEVPLGDRISSFSRDKNSAARDEEGGQLVKGLSIAHGPWQWAVALGEYGRRGIGPKARLT